MGRVIDICVEKKSEFEEGNPNRKFKRRLVFEGCYVKDERNNSANLADIASCPATMEAGNAADGYGLLSGHDVQQADGESAYTQAQLGGEETWIRLPPDRWPKEWIGKYTDPDCSLLLASYGHPDVRGFWERHCEAALALGGFEPIYLNGRVASGIPASSYFWLCMWMTLSCPDLHKILLKVGGK